MARFLDSGTHDLTRITTLGDGKEGDGPPERSRRPAGSSVPDGQVAPPEGAEAIAQLGRALEVEALRGILHLAFQPLDRRAQRLGRLYPLVGGFRLARRVVALPHRPGDLADRPPDRLRGDAVLGVVRRLEPAPPLGLAEGGPYRVRDLVRVHDHLAANVPGGAAGRLDERSRRAEIPLLVGVQDRDQ